MILQKLFNLLRSEGQENILNIFFFLEKKYGIISLEWRKRY